MNTAAFLIGFALPFGASYLLKLYRNAVKHRARAEEAAAIFRLYYLGHLSDVDLRNINLRGADLRGADLRGADLRGADLRK